MNVNIAVCYYSQVRTFASGIRVAARHCSCGGGRAASYRTHGIRVTCPKSRAGRSGSSQIGRTSVGFGGGTIVSSSRRWCGVTTGEALGINRKRDMSTKYLEQYRQSIEQIHCMRHWWGTDIGTIPTTAFFPIVCFQLHVQQCTPTCGVKGVNVRVTRMFPVVYWLQHQDITWWSDNSVFNTVVSWGGTPAAALGKKVVR